MKKLSISLFAVLAIIFAVSSAFTTLKTKKADERYRVWGVTPLNVSLPADEDDADGKIVDVLFDQADPITEFDYEDLAEFESQNSGIFTCIQNTAIYGCLVYVDEATGTSPSQVVLEATDGSYDNGN